MRDFILEKDLNRFFPPDDPFLQEVVERAVNLRADPDNSLDVHDLARLALYQPVLYCGTLVEQSVFFLVKCLRCYGN